MSTLNVVQLRPPKSRPRFQSQYDKFPLPFFDKNRRCTLAVQPSGNYTEDCATGRAYAIEFLKSCDGTYGWLSLLGPIIGDMIVAGCGRWLDGGAKPNGVVIGFMRVIAKAAALGTTVVPPEELID